MVFITWFPATLNISLFTFILSLLWIEVQSEDFYSFEVLDIDGKSVPLETYRGKAEFLSELLSVFLATGYLMPSLVVNVASECGYTHSHYEALSQLSQAREIKHHLNILAFPCNQFGAQEPGTNAEIVKFAKDTYNCNFPVFSKIDVVGENAHPAYQYLTKNSGMVPNWNFWKYLVDPDGQVVNAWGPQTSVHDLWNDLVSIATRRAPREDL